MLLLLVTLGVGGALAFLAGEVLVRVAGLSKTLDMRNAAARQPPITGGPIAGRYAASRSWTGAYGVTYQSNAEGFRDREILVEKPAGVKRIAVLGDSVAEGLGVDVGVRFSTLLEEWLNKRGGTRYEVLNFARAGYSTVDELEILRRVVPRYRPDHVLLQFCVNDIEENAQKSAARQGPPGIDAGSAGLRSFFQAHSALNLFLAERYNGVLLQHGAPNRLLKTILQIQEADLGLSEGLLEQSAALCREQQISLTVTYVPQDAEVRVASLVMATHLESHLTRSCQRIGVRFVSTLSPLRAAKGCSTHIDDCHLSPCGHRLVAEHIASFF